MWRLGCRKLPSIDLRQEREARIAVSRLGLAGTGMFVSLVRDVP